jgi:hypothetical protein
MEAEDKTLNDAASEDNNQSNETNSEGESNESSQEGERTYTQSELDNRVKEQDKRWKDRIKGLKGEEDSEEGGKEATESTKKVDGDERYDRLNLKTEGIKDTKEQDVVLDYAKFKGISVDQAINTPAVKAELKELRTANSTPSPSPRTGTGMRDEVSHDAAMLAKGERLPTAERRKAAREYLSKR